MLIPCPECQKSIADSAKQCPACGYAISLSSKESEDRDYADWQRVRTSIEHENGLINHRLTWLFASQGFLFTTFGVALSAWKNPQTLGTTPQTAGTDPFLYLLIIVAFLGVAICLLIWRGLTHAEIQLRRLDRWWYEENRENLTGEVLEVPYHRRDEKRSSSMKKKLVKHPPLRCLTSPPVFS